MLLLILFLIECYYIHEKKGQNLKKLQELRMLFSHRLLIDKRHSISRMSKISQTIATMVNTLISQSKTMSPIMLSLWIIRMTRRGTKQGLRLSQLFFYLIWEFQNSVVNVGKNCRLFHLGVGCIHVPIFDVVPRRPLIIIGSKESHSLDRVVEEHGILWHNSHRLSQT